MSDPVPVDDAKKRKATYKKSLNLPKTPFPMRANLAQNEPQSLRRWEKEGLFEQILSARHDAPVFSFHDGPPFANGNIHVGHLLNKVLKDMVVRSRLLMGYKCHYVPGWDCHGLPIEHKVEMELIDSGKMKKLSGLTVDQRRMAIRRECQRYAEKFKKLQAQQMQRLLTLGDYKNPYMTMAPGYEESVLEVFAGLIEQGLVYRDLKPVHWSVANQTALADAELEYQDREDPSIYVCFDAADPAALSGVFGVAVESLGASPSLMIWTTTPWTLPANRLICVHEDFDYALASFEDASGATRHTVVAARLLEAVGEVSGRPLREVARVKGSELVGLEYRRPLAEDGVGRVVLGEHVTLEDGTGLVHTAPGHGHEDFDTGQREGLEPYCPVRGDGSYDDTVAEWLRGVVVWDANPRIIEHLRESEHLFFHKDFWHSYPHDWRSKTPVIFRTTEQWFIAVDRPTVRDGKSLRQLALESTADNVNFVPGWGQNRMRGMLESRPDWCISRQRAWGLPIPAFRTPEGEVVLTSASVRAVAEVFGREGSDAWFLKEPSDLLASWDAAADPDLGDLEIRDPGSLEKMYDICDVWLESGSSWNAVVRRRDLGYPTDLYLEGSDQHRGWFQLSLLPALGVTGVSPFKAVLTHGFTVDKDGKKMSKSLNNALKVEDLLKAHGADVLRWWVSSLAFEQDMKIDPHYFDLAGDSYRKVRNTLRFLLSNLADFEPEEHLLPVSQLAPTSPDAWVLGKLEELRAQVFEAFEGYQFRQAHLLIFDFCNDTLSSFYLDAVKDRLYCDVRDSARRRSTQSALWRLAGALCSLLSPILPHTADEAHGALHGEDGSGSVHLKALFALETPEISAGWDSLLAARSSVLKALEDAKGEGIENPLDAGVRLGGAEDLAPFEADLADLFGVSRVDLVPSSEGGAAVEVVDLKDQPRCERSWRRDRTVKKRSDGGYLSDRDARAVHLA
ncbi:MAG: isoleucine--tRNA ligase [Acidobacteriota bacterium]